MLLTRISFFNVSASCRRLSSSFISEALYSKTKIQTIRIGDFEKGKINTESVASYWQHPRNHVLNQGLTT